MKGVDRKRPSRVIRLYQSARALSLSALLILFFVSSCTSQRVITKGRVDPLMLEYEVEFAIPFMPFDRLRTGFDRLSTNGISTSYAVHPEPVEG